MRTIAALLLGVLLTAGSVLYASQTQARVADENFREARAAKQLALEVLQRERSLEDYSLGARQSALEEYAVGGRRIRAELTRAQQLSVDSREEEAAIAEQQRAVRVWEAMAERALAAKDVNAAVEAGEAARGRVLDRFLRASDRFQADLEATRVEELHAAALVPVKLVLALAALFGATAAAIVPRRRRAARRAAVRREDGRRSRERFGEALQVAADQDEANGLLVTHLERTVPGAHITVLNRNNSMDRLEPATPLPVESPLEAPLQTARPRSCLAVRLSRRYDRGGEAEEVLSCELCGRLEGASTCRPLLVGGEVIGSVLAEHAAAAREEDVERIDGAVEQAAPVLANLRNLALAEMRAATDALTGLANRRALDDHLKRMVAQAGRSATPLSVVLLDLDHFKRINDNYGHERGDEVLAALGALLREDRRGSDLACRSGGEEFVVLLPDTGRDGALAVAENIRGALRHLRVELEDPVTASFGVATCPDDAGDAAALLRAADRALYAAKQAGRDRVEAAV